MQNNQCLQNCLYSVRQHDCDIGYFVLHKKVDADQWRIQDFPEWRAPTAEFGAKTYYFARFLLKTAWKWKKLDR